MKMIGSPVSSPVDVCVCAGPASEHAHLQSRRSLSIPPLEILLLWPDFCSNIDNGRMKLANNEKLTLRAGASERIRWEKKVTMTRRSKQLKPSNGLPFYGKQNGHFGGRGRETVPHHRQEQEEDKRDKTKAQAREHSGQDIQSLWLVTRRLKRK